mmetsp:Transcript_138/g.373  ORF Transcript_138/g.373 Transcript_138/m.373 type:complete len:215 (-) Transcript_138:538-1182(-)
MRRAAVLARAEHLREPLLQNSRGFGNNFPVACFGDARHVDKLDRLGFVHLGEELGGVGIGVEGMLREHLDEDALGVEGAAVFLLKDAHHSHAVLAVQYRKLSIAVLMQRNNSGQSQVQRLRFVRRHGLCALMPINPLLLPHRNRRKNPRRNHVHPLRAKIRHHRPQYRMRPQALPHLRPRRLLRFEPLDLQPPDMQRQVGLDARLRGLLGLFHY